MVCDIISFKFTLILKIALNLFHRDGYRLITWQINIFFFRGNHDYTVLLLWRHLIEIISPFVYLRRIRWQPSVRVTRRSLSMFVSLPKICWFANCFKAFYSYCKFRLMARDKFIPATTLNLLTVGFLQMMLHDWFDHGPVDTSCRIMIKLHKDDPDYHKFKGEMKIPRTKEDNCKQFSVT